ncbi:adenylate/guanylate cyclase domain-containing protein [Sphingobium sp. AN641]|uniref:adenylate/guanylate cyclase domain-containing protein n=1 Tax=Sphingobium sp. AN641 TaxID=3133443 RepID=UPI0030BCF7CA
MANPSSNELTPAYYRAQIGRVVATLNKIVKRPNPLTLGHVVPDADDIAIHDGRRLEATVMFLDICKFSNRPCESAEEQVTIVQILSLFFTEMIRIIADHGGVVEKNTGDGLMAYFAKNDIPGISIQQRALTCALTMFSAADNLINPLLSRSNIQMIDFRVCLDHGFITVAKVGAARGFNGIVAVGTTANVASKMLKVAGANTILLGNEMLSGLPAGWVQQYVQLETLESGWTYRQSQTAYAFWRYIGRWKIPVI